MQEILEFSVPKGAFNGLFFLLVDVLRGVPAGRLKLVATFVNTNHVRI